MPRDRVFRFLVTAEERLELERQALLEGVSVAQLIRRRMLRDDVPRPDSFSFVRRVRA